MAWLCCSMFLKTPDFLGASWSDCSIRKHPWKLTARCRLLNPQGKLSIRHGLLKLVKSTPTRLLFFFLVTIGMTSHSVYQTSIIDPVPSNRSTLPLTVLDLSELIFLLFYLIGLKVVSILSSLQENTNVMTTVFFVNSS